MFVGRRNLGMLGRQDVESNKIDNIDFSYSVRALSAENYSCHLLKMDLLVAVKDLRGYRTVFIGRPCRRGLSNIINDNIVSNQLTRV